MSTMLFAIENLEKEQLPAAVQAHIKSMKADLADLNALVSNCLNYVRYADEQLPLHYKKIRVYDWLRDCMDKYQAAPKKIRLLGQAEKEITAYWDADLMKHVMYNLLDNAMKYARSTIQVSLVEATDHHDIVIRVDNDGAAITGADKERIFTPFSGLQQDGGKSFGLGLSIAQSIVQRHQGSICIHDSQLGGTCLVVCLPDNLQQLLHLHDGYVYR